MRNQIPKNIAQVIAQTTQLPQKKETEKELGEKPPPVFKAYQGVNFKETIVKLKEACRKFNETVEKKGDRIRRSEFTLLKQLVVYLNIQYQTQNALRQHRDSKGTLYFVVQTDAAAIAADEFAEDIRSIHSNLKTLFAAGLLYEIRKPISKGQGSKPQNGYTFLIGIKEEWIVTYSTVVK